MAARWIKLKRAWCYVAHWRHQELHQGFGWHGWRCGRCGFMWFVDWEDWAKNPPETSP
jgi:hypothetical protein